MSRIFSIIIAMAMVFTSVSCSTDKDTSSVKAEVKITEKTTFSLKIEHMSLTSGNKSITETHKATLLADRTEVESKTYNVKWNVSANSISIKRSAAEELQHKELDYKSEGVNIAGQTVNVTLELASCETVEFNTNFETYCHPEFPQDGCEELLTNCELSVKKITFGILSGNQLICSAVIGSNTHTCNYPLTINVTNDNEEVETTHVRAELNENVLLDHHKATLVRNGQTADSDNYVATWSLSYNRISIERSVAESLVGVEIDNNNGFNIKGQTITVNTNLANCTTAKLDGKVYCHPSFPADGAIAKLDCCDPKATMLKFNNINDNELCGTVTISSDHGSIEYPVSFDITEDPVVEPEDEYDVVINDDLTFGNGKATVSVDLYKNGDKVKTVNLENAFNATLKAGAQINKTSNGSVSLNNTVATLGNGTASFTYNLAGTSFGDAWTWSAPSKVTFTYEWNGIKKSKDFTVNYAVKSTNFSGNNGTYRNNASLFANGTAVAADVQAIVVTKPMDKTINGYTAIAAYITNCYHSNGSLVDDGKHLAVVFRNDSNPSQYIIRHADTNGKVIEDHYANNVDENAVFSFITIDGKMQPAYLDVIMSGNSPKEWGYLHIGSNKIFAINNMIVTTNRLSHPVIETGKVQDGVLTINGLKFK